MRSFCVFCLLLALITSIRPVQAQTGFSDWFSGETQYLKVGVVADGMYYLTGADVQAAGISLAMWPLDKLTLLHEGQPVPLLVLGGSGATLAPTDTLVFVGQRNTGADESWAYDRADSQSSTHYSLFSDTTYYWLYAAGTPGLRYGAFSPAAPSTPTTRTVRDTLHVENEVFSYDGDSENSGNPLYTRGEGTFGHRFFLTSAATQDATFLLKLPLFVQQDSVAVRVQLSAGSSSPHHMMLFTEQFAGSALQFVQQDEKSWTGYSFARLQARLAATDVVSNGDFRARLRLDNASGSNPNIVFVDYFEVAYGRRLAATAGRDAFSLASGPVRLRMGGYGNDDAFALAPALGLAAHGTARADTFDVAATLPRAAHVVTARRDALQQPARLARYAAPALTSALGADYVIITTPALRASAEALAAEKQARQGLSTLVVLQSDVFDQFDYGRATPVALRRFLYATRTWTRAPQFVTLWGDALTLSRSRPLQPWEVVTFGNAPSDAWYAMQYGGPTDWTEFVAIGRLPIRSNDAGVRFVNKLQAYATAPAGAWQGRSIHASGGYSLSEVATLGSYVSSWGATGVNSAVALDTVRLVKRSLLTVDALYRDRITEEMRKGLAWFAFFGHSSTQIWEILIDPPPAFRNAPFLPAVFTFGCRTGAFTIGSPTQNTLSLAEQLVIESEHGAISHWGSSELSTIGSGGFLGDELHRLVFDDSLRVLGEATRQAKNTLARLVTGGSGVKNLLQYGLVGDPATPLRLPTLPNLHVSAADIRFSKTDPLVADSTLGVDVKLRSWGLVPSDSVDVALYHNAPGSAPVRQTRRVPPFPDSLTVAFTIALSDGSAGEHRFEVVVDEGNAFAEEDETDNRATQQIPVLSGDVALVSPASYAFVGEGPVLRLSRSSLVRDTVEVMFEVDTTATFTSPARLQHQTTATTFAQWTVPGLLPGQPYYWRARIEGIEAPWTTSSFTLLPALAGQTGWMQTGAQLQQASADGLHADGDRWYFDTYDVRLQPTSERGSGEYKGQINVDDESYLTLTLGWGFVVLDGVSGMVKAAVHAPTYPMAASLQQRFGTAEQARARLDSLAQTLHVGDVVIGRSRFLGNSGGTAIGEDVKTLVRGLGSAAVDTITYGHLWQMVTRVGYPAQRWEQTVAPGGTNEIVHDTLLTFRQAAGTLTSTPIGPAQAWAEAGAPLSTPADARLTVHDARTDSLLAQAAPGARADLSTLSPALHPRLRLRYHVRDTTYSTGVNGDARVAAVVPAQWFLAYTPVPDLLLDGPSGTAPALLQEGERFEATYPVRNLGLAAAPGVVVSFFVTDAQNRERLVGRDTLGTVAAGAVQPASIAFPTHGSTGSNSLRVRVDQASALESVTFNNFYRHPFTISGDATPPVYSIVIDGVVFPADPTPVRNIQDPAFPFVSARPTIEVSIDDENAFRPLTDSSVVQLTLDGKAVPLSSPDVQFEPAAPGKTTARLVYTPDLSGRDTTHTLVLRAFDASGNEAADSPYQVHFRVQNTLEVEQVLPYPNPMNTQTTFAFRVKGADAAGITECRLRIYTLTGLLVREFDLVGNPALLDRGALSIGWNKLRWDGTDADGDRLATGVYLYRVFVRGESGKLGSTDVERIAIIR